MTRNLVCAGTMLVLATGCARTGDRAERAADTLATSSMRAMDSVAGTTSASGGTLSPDDIDIEGLEVGRTVGADGKISDETDEFRPTDEIIAVVETDDNEAGKELLARWTYGEDDKSEQVVNEQRQTVGAGRDARTTFRLTRQGAWPVGKYHLRIMAGGKEVKSKEFEVKAR